jgi:transcription initiation factor TFIIE subunit alpha
MVQVDPVIAHLKRIDDMTIQENTFESALTKAVPAQSTATGAYAVARGRKLGPVSASAQKTQATLHVSITANDENLDREQEEREERQKKMEQNALPSWHAASTLEKKPAEDQVDSLPDSSSVSPAENAEPPTEDVKIDTTELKEKEAQDALAAYYAQLAEQEEDDDDDDDEDLEDI